METIIKYERACNALAREFIKEFYTYEQDYHWAGGEIGGVACIGDEFWNTDNMVDALKNKPTENQLFTWYYQVLVNKEAKINYNLKSFLHIKPEPITSPLEKTVTDAMMRCAYK